MPIINSLRTIMSYIRYKKVGDTEYAYEITAYWDKDKKHSLQKSKYLGIVLDKEDGIFQEVKRRKRDLNGKVISNPNRQATQYRNEKEIVSFGSGYLTKKLIEEDDVGKIFADLLPKAKLKTLKSLLSYRLINGAAMYLANDWYEGDISKHLLPSSAMSSQAISNFLKELGDEKLQKDFFRKYLPIATKDNKEGLIVDGSSLPNEINTSISEFGYNSGSIDKQIKFMSVVSADNNLPLYFRYNAGSIADISTLTNTIKELKAHNTTAKAVLLDAGFYSNDNIELLQKNKINFIIRLPSGRKLFKEVIDNEKIDLASNAVKVSKKRVVFIKEKEIKLSNKKVYAYIILDPKKKADLVNSYLSEKIDDKQKINDAEMSKIISQKGLFVIISSKKQKTDNILNLYYTRQKVERMFAFSKSDLNLLPLRVHSEEALRGHLFLLFLLSYFFMKIHQKLNKEFTVEQAFIILSAQKAKIYEKQIFVQEATKKQKQIFELLGYDMPEEIARG